MQKNNRNKESDDLGAISIGAMIVFIALILVAAVASAVIIQTGEKLQQNAQQAGSDTQQEISGKVSIVTIWIGDTPTPNNEEITMVFELAPGSEPIDSDQIHWAVICDDGAGTPGLADGDLSAATELDDATTPADDTFLPGETYMVHLNVGDGGPTCAPTLNEEHQMVISAKGGGTTFETLSYTSEDQGAIVV